MAINFISNAINNIVGISPDNSGDVLQAKQALELSRLSAEASLSELKSLVVGDTLSGTLLNQDGKKISLLLNNGMTLNTALDGDVNIAMGKQLSFEVRSNQNGQLTLRPMFTNLSNSNTITNALNEASIEVSRTTIEMVDTLMRNNMPIDKDMLSLINRELTLYPDADVADLVMLHKMNIPVSDSSVRQMHLYMNNNQWMFDNLDNSAGELTNLIISSYSEDDINSEFLNNLSNLLKPLEQSETSLDSSNLQFVGGSLEKNDTLPEKMLSGDIAASENIVQDTENELNAINKFNIFDKLTTLEKDKLISTEVRQKIETVLNELLKDNFLMQPKDFGDEKYVQKYYENISRLSEQLSSVLNGAGKGETEFAKTVSNIKENTNFINHVNELYNYVQLPLKMNNIHTNGDLYVYAKKGGSRKSSENKSLTALLHLSMNYLGNMDIFLTLNKGQKLSTKFTLEKEEMIDFLEGHMDELNQRLVKKGYNIESSKVEKNEKEKGNVIANIINEETGGQKVLLSTQSFDARA